MKINAVTNLLQNQAIRYKSKNYSNPDNIILQYERNVESFKGKNQSDKERSEKITLDDGRTAVIYYNKDDYISKIQIYPSWSFYDYVEYRAPKHHGEYLLKRFVVKSPDDGSEQTYGFFYNRDENLMESRPIGLGCAKII